MVSVEEDLASKLVKYIKIIGVLATAMIGAATTVATISFRLGSEMTASRIAQENTNKEIVSLRTEVGEMKDLLKQRDDAIEERIWASIALTSWECRSTPMRGGILKDCTIRRGR